MPKKSGRGKWILLLLIVVGAVLYYNTGDKPKETAAPQQLYKLEKAGAGTTADYTATARRIHAAVDSGLLGAKLSAQSVQETNRETPRQKVEGSIRWHARQLLVSVPPDTKVEAVQQALQGPLKSTGGEVLSSQPDNYQGLPVVRIDVGVRDSLAGDPLTLITDRIYVTTRKKSEALLPVKPPTGGSGRLAIVIDDFGYSSEPIGAFAAISRPITFSVFPYRPYSNEAASRALSSGHQVMLHLPMEALSAAEQAEPTSITVAMADPDIQQAVNKAVQAVPGIIGVNNHQGSKATADRRVMRDVLTILKANNLFFVDSRTNSQSVAAEMSQQMGLRTGENDLFIDNSADVEAIKNQLRTATHLAIQHGSITVIGHARMSTATAVREMIPEIEAAGVKLVFESELVR